MQFLVARSVRFMVYLFVALLFSTATLADQTTIPNYTKTRTQPTSGKSFIPMVDRRFIATNGLKAAPHWTLSTSILRRGWGIIWIWANNENI